MKLTTQIHIEIDTDGEPRMLHERIRAITQEEVMRYSAAVADRLEAEGITDATSRSRAATSASGDAVEAIRGDGVMGGMRTPTVTEIPVVSLARVEPDPFIETRAHQRDQSRARKPRSARGERDPSSSRA